MLEKLNVEINEEIKNFEENFIPSHKTPVTPLSQSVKKEKNSMFGQQSSSILDKSLLTQDSPSSEDNFGNQRSNDDENVNRKLFESNNLEKKKMELKTNDPLNNSITIGTAMQSKEYDSPVSHSSTSLGENSEKRKIGTETNVSPNNS